MKKIKKIVAILISVLCAGALAFALPACGEPEEEGGTHTTHVDSDGDGKCDECGEDMGTQTPPDEPDGPDEPDTPDTPDEPDQPDTPDEPCTEHVDGDDDNICDNCGRGLQSDKANEYIFEAEYCNLDDCGGPGWSGSFSGPQIIRQDVDNASNGYFVSFLYSEGNNLTFEFTSDIAEKGDVVLRLSTIVPDMWLASEEVWNIVINGEVIDYGDIYLTGIEGGLNEVAPFVDAIVIEDFDILAGENKIELITVNSIPPQVTGQNMTGTAPEVDCIKVYSDTAVLDWEPLEENTWYI